MRSVGSQKSIFGHFHTDGTVGAGTAGDIGSRIDSVPLLAEFALSTQSAVLAVSTMSAVDAVGMLGCVDSQ